MHPTSKNHNTISNKWLPSQSKTQIITQAARSSQVNRSNKIWLSVSRRHSHVTQHFWRSFLLGVIWIARENSNSMIIGALSNHPRCFNNKFWSHRTTCHITFSSWIKIQNWKVKCIRKAKWGTKQKQMKDKEHLFATLVNALKMAAKAIS